MFVLVQHHATDPDGFRAAAFSRNTYLPVAVEHALGLPAAKG